MKGSEQVRRRRGKISFIVLASAITLAILSAVIGASLYPPRRNVTSFACCPMSNEQVFSLYAEVDLTDGMDESEANKVAMETYRRISETPSPPTQKRLYYSSNTELMSQESVWTVKFSLFYEMINPRFARTVYQREDFEAIISPINRTIAYNLTLTEW